MTKSWWWWWWWWWLWLWTGKMAAPWSVHHHQETEAGSPSSDDYILGLGSRHTERNRDVNVPVDGRLSGRPGREIVTANADNNNSSSFSQGSHFSEKRTVRENIGGWWTWNSNHPLPRSPVQRRRRHRFGIEIHRNNTHTHITQSRGAVMQKYFGIIISIQYMCMNIYISATWLVMPAIYIIIIYRSTLMYTRINYSVAIILYNQWRWTHLVRKRI